jgi:hypothetical protein
MIGFKGSPLKSPRPRACGDEETAPKNNAANPTQINVLLLYPLAFTSVN